MKTVLALLSCALSLSDAWAAGRPVEPAPAVAPGGLSPASHFGQLPLYFEVNEGQAEPSVLFVAHGRDHHVYLTREGALLDLAGDTEESRLNRSTRWAGRTNASASAGRTVRLTLPGANPEPVVTGLEPGSGKVNYLLGPNPAFWKRGVPIYARVSFEEIYPGVTLVYYGNDRQLEFDFVVEPGAAAEVIRLRFEGAERLSVDEHGDLVLQVGQRQLRQHRPVAYQMIGGMRREVSARYQLMGSGTVRFVLGRYDTRHALTIDPVLSYSTYLGGNKGDVGWAIAVDALGNAFVAGDTRSMFTKLPVSGYQTNFGGRSKYGGDAFVAKIDPSGTNLLFLTYLGGSGIDGAVGLALDNMGCAFITGYTDSTNFPTAGAPAILQPEIAGTNDPVFLVHAPDVFVTKLDASGSSLVYSTYLGGEGNDIGSHITVDGTGAAYVVGTTESAIVYETSNQVCRVFCTNSMDTTNICGISTCTTNVTMTRFFQPVLMVTNLIRDKNFEVVTEEITTTLLGVRQVSQGFPTVNAPQTNNHGGENLFVSKLSPNGDTLVYATYWGGSGTDQGNGIAVDPAGRAMFCGSSASLDFPVTNAIQGVHGGIVDAVAAKLDAAGGTIIYSTFLGGTRTDVGYRVATDAAGAAYVAGAEGSSDFPSTPGAFNGGGIFQSTDVGGSWNLSSGGLTHTVVQALLADPGNPGTLYAGTPRGVFRSVNSGATWVNLSTGLVNRSILTLALDSSNAVLYAGTAGGLFSSTNAGLNWDTNGAGIASTSIRALLFPPDTNGVVYAGTSGGVFKRDGGATNFVALNAGLKNRSVNVLVQPASDLTVLYAGTDGGVFKSTNSAANWKGSSAGLKTKKTLAMALDPSNAEVLYAGTSKGLFKSTDAATNWVQMTNGMGRPSVNALLVDPVLPSTLYAGTSDGLYKSLDAGVNWTPSDTNLTTRLVAALAFATGSTTTLYAGTKGTNFAGGTNDAFLVKIAPDGSSLNYAFTLGGSKSDEAWDVAVDAMGYAVLTGATASKNFPVAGSSFASQTNNAGHTDVFITKVDPTGSSNIFSIYLGGKANDVGHGLALDPLGCVYVVGQTSSSRFIVTNAIQPTFSSGGNDAFVLKLLPAPGMTLAREGKNLVLSWIPFPNPYVLESRDPLDLESRWTPMSQVPVLRDGHNVLVLPASDACRVFRLRALHP